MCVICQAAVANGLVEPADVLHGPGLAAMASAGAVIGYTPPNPLPEYAPNQIIQAMRTSWVGDVDTNGDFARNNTVYSWSGNITFRLITSVTVVNEGSGANATTTTRDAMSAHEQQRITEAFEIWDDFIAVSISPDQVNGKLSVYYVSGGTMSSNGNENGDTSGVTFAGTSTYTDNPAPSIYGTPARTTVTGHLNIGRNFNAGEFDGRVGNGGVADNGVNDLAYGMRGFETIMHEIGHTLGLSHPGIYDATGPSTAAGQLFAQETRQLTIMSYINENAVIGDDGWPLAQWQGLFASTPMIYDILAIQAVYGADLTTRTGNTSYGWVNTSGRDAYTFSETRGGVFTIYDAGGAADMLDASGFTDGAFISLEPGTYSDIGFSQGNSGGDMVGNIGIAFGTIIENARGGSGNDEIIGNSSANILYGHAGRDELRGMDGADTLDAGFDNDGAELFGDNQDDYIYASGGADIIDGGAHNDILDYSRSNAGVVFNLAAGPGTGGWANGDTITGIEEIRGSGYGDVMRGSNAADILKGAGGNDTVDGGAGIDIVWGEAGDDILIGGALADGIVGGDGYDQASYSTAVTLDFATGNHSGEAVGDSYSSIEQWTGSPFNDVMIAGFDGRRFAGGDGVDHLYGSDNFNDWLQGGRGTDYLDGKGGVDIASYADAPSAISVDMGLEVDTSLGHSQGKVSVGDWGVDTLVSIEGIEGTAFADEFFGDARNNWFYGLGGDDEMIGGGGSDFMYGGDGNDRFTAAVGDYIWGDAGFDVMTVEGANFLDFNFVTERYNINGSVATQIYRILDVELIYGTAGNDIFTGAGANDGWDLGDGNDTMSGGNGDDVLYTGAGADVMDGGAGRDTMAFHKAMVADWQSGVLDADIVADSWLNWEIIRGSSGEDRIRTNSWGFSVELRGGAGNDVLATGPGGVVGDFLYGEDGADNLDGGAGNDVMHGGEGDDILVIGPGSDIIDGGGGTDTLLFTTSMTMDWQNNIVDAAIATDALSNWEIIQGASGVDIIRMTDLGRSISLRGGAGADILATSSTADSLYGEAGDDDISGGSGNDVLEGGQGADLIDGGSGNDTVSHVGDIATAFVQLAWAWARDGWGTEDRLTSIENITGSAFSDVLIGWNGASVIKGGAGNDWIEDVGDGDDALNGEAGNDIVFGGAGNDSLAGGDGNDALLGGAGNDTFDGGAGADWIYAGLGADVVVGGADNDVLFGGDGGGLGDSGDTINGGDGDDALMGEQGDDALNGGAGIDWAYGGAGNDSIYGGLGDDVLIGGDGGNGADGNDTITGADGNDSLIGQAGADVLNADAGNDWAYGGAGNDVINGGLGNDVLAGEQGDDTINGGDGDDFIFGAEGNDILNGGAGNDWIEGSFGGSRITGGLGADSLFGGDGAHFIYTNVNESTEAAADVIGIFWRGDGVDRIDVSAIDADGNAANGVSNFSFVSAFTNVAGQAVITWDAPGNRSIARFDVNGDGASDMTIVVLGVQLVAGDFVL